MWRFVQGVIGSITGLLRNVFLPRKEEALKARVYWNDGIALTLQDLAQETETRASGRVQVITLADFRASIPDLWDKYKDRILIIAESSISRGIGKGNTFIPQGDDTWLMLFNAADDEEAQARTDAIAAKIGEKLMGARFSPEAPPLPTTAKLNLNSAMRADGSIDLDAVKTAVNKARRAQAPFAPGAPPPPTPSKVARPKPAPPPPAAPAPEFAISFRLAWCAETQSIDTFTLRVLNDMGVNVFAETAPTVSPLAAVAIVRMGAALFRTMCAAGVRAKFCIPIPFSVLETPAFGEIQQAINEINQQARLVQLRVIVSRIPARASLDQLAAVRELFRPFVRDVAFMIDPFLLEDQALALEHIVLYADVTGRDIRDNEFLQTMHLLRQSAGGKVVHLAGLQSHKQLTSAVNAGIDEVSGPAVHDDLKVLPASVMVVRRQDLLLP